MGWPLFFFNFFIVIHSIVISMNVENLKLIIDKLPGDYIVLVKHGDLEIPLSDIIEVDIEHGKLLLK